MTTIKAPNPMTAAQQHLERAHAFYSRLGDGESAMGELTAGLLAMSRQVARIELAVIAAHEC